MKRLLVIVMAITILMMGALPSTGFAKTASGHDKAMWEWTPGQDISTAAARQEMVDFALSKGVNVIYLSTGTYLDEHQGEYRQFITLVHSKGIDVYALDGDPSWAYTDNHYIALSRVNDVYSYNRSVGENARFVGIQFDIEPYLLPEWSTDQRDRLISEYLNGLKQIDHLVNAHRPQPLSFIVAMPFWFDGAEYADVTYQGVTKGLYEHVIDLVSGGVAIMDYRDRSDLIISSAQNEIDYAAQTGRKVVIGVETQHLPLDIVTFYEEGEAYMNQALAEVDDHYSDSLAYGGLAIHWYHSYRDMAP